MRLALTFFTLALGVLLALLSYLLAAPVGVPTDESFSNPKVPFAAAFFVLGVFIAFAAALVYELLPDRKAT